MKHAINWFEIPVTDINRAQQFYELIFQFEMAFMDLGESFKMAVFPGEANCISGALVFNESWYTPSETLGPLLYLNANPDLEIVADRIEAAGGKILLPKRQISPKHGFMAVFLDTEGNRVALHSIS